MPHHRNAETGHRSHPINHNRATRSAAGARTATTCAIGPRQCLGAGARQHFAAASTIGAWQCFATAPDPGTPSEVSRP